MVIKNPPVEVNLEWKFKYKTTLDVKVTLEVENISENKFSTNSVRNWFNFYDWKK